MANKMKKNSKMPPCFVCKKEWTREDNDKFYSYEEKIVCRNHHGIEEWYKNLLEQAMNKNLLEQAKSV